MAICDTCSERPYAVTVDWNNDGSYSEMYDDITARVLAAEPIAFGYGRDQGRALLPTAAGSGSFAVHNVDRMLSPENVDSPIAADIQPGRNARIEYAERINMATNPSFETSIAGWTSTNTTLSSTTSNPLVGARALQSVVSSVATTPAVTGPDQRVVPNKPYAVSLSVRLNTAGTRSTGVKMIFLRADGSIALNPTTVFTSQASGSYQRRSAVHIAPSDAVTARVTLAYLQGTSVVGDSYNIDAVMVEQCNEVRDYFDGSSAGAFWRGPAGLSTSVQGKVLYTGRIDDFGVSADFSNRTISISLIDGLQQTATLSTELYQTIRSGTAMNVILDQIGWPADKRDIDPGASFFRYWWEEGKDALQAIIDIVYSEGPPALVYVTPDNVFTFRDRHHRLLRPESVTSQATFWMPSLDCDVVPVGTQLALTNAGFEVNTTGWVGNQAAIARTTTESHSGVASCQMTPNGAAAQSSLDQTSAGAVPVTDLTRHYRMTAWVKSNVGYDEVSCSILWRDVGATTIGTVNGTPQAIPAGEWTQIHVDGIPISGTVAALLRVRESGSPTAADVLYVDDVTFEYAPGGYTYTAPFSYDHGFRDIVNQAIFEVPIREPLPTPQVVWENANWFSMSTGQSLTFNAKMDDPFYDAFVTNEDTAGATVASISRTSGQATQITITASAPTTVTRLKVWATTVPVSRTEKIVREDSTSITANGVRTYPNEAPWANIYDAQAIGDIVLGYYATRRPTVSMRIVNCDALHLQQILDRTISDRIAIVNGELGMNADFHIERIQHEIRGLGKVHAAVLVCEKAPIGVTSPNVPFTFDVAGRGFDDGVFDASGGISDTDVFIFDDPIQGQFDNNRFGY